MFLIKNPKKNISISPIIKNNSGIALIITVIILTNLLMITLIITDVVLRIGKSSQQISEAEVAYLAAESATEQAIYEIEQNKDASNLGISSAVTTGNLADVDANWERYIEPIYQIEITCVDSEGKFTYYPDVSKPQEVLAQIYPLILSGSGCVYEENLSGLINNSNALAVILPPDGSFELDLDVNSPTGLSPSFYPDKIEINYVKYPINTGNPEGTIITLDNTTQEIYHTQNENSLSLPTNGNFGSNPGYHLRIINEDSDIVIYLIEPSFQDQYLPVGLKIISNGYYSANKRKERTIEFEKRFWQIY